MYPCELDNCAPRNDFRVDFRLLPGHVECTPGSLKFPWKANVHQEMGEVTSLDIGEYPMESASDEYLASLGLTAGSGGKDSETSK